MCKHSGWIDCSHRSNCISMKKPRINDRMLVDNKVKFVSGVKEVNPGRYSYFMTDASGDATGKWYNIFELREELFLDYLFNRPGYFGTQTNKKATVEVILRLTPLFFFGFGGVAGVVGIATSGWLMYKWIKQHHAWYIECCKNKEETDN